MRFPSGVTDQYLYFVAVDATDYVTRETGLSSFTVRRSRNGAASAAYTTPTINETDVTNMPGVYELLLDEDMTLDAGDQSQEVCLHITHAGMAPVTRVFELYRPSVTAGETLAVASGVADANIEQIKASAPDATNFDRVFKSASVTLTADSGTTTTLTDAALTQPDTDYWKGMTVMFSNGTLSGLSRTITAFDPATDTLTFAPALPVAVSTHAYTIMSFGSAPAVGLVADAVWDEAQADHVAVGSFGVTASEIADILVDTAEIGAAGVGLTAIATQASVNTIDDFLDTDIAAVITAVDALPTNAELATALGTADDAVLAAIAALNNLSAAQVNAEVVDALATDTYAEPGQGTPAATASLASKIGYLYKAWRNKKTVTATTHSLFADDATTVDQKSTVSDAAGTFTETEKATGP